MMIPVMDRDAILLSPRTKNNFAISQTNISRLRSPHDSDCRDDYPPEVRFLIPNGTHLHYDQDICHSLFHKKIVWDKCKCFEGHTNTESITNHSKLCTYENTRGCKTLDTYRK